MLPQIQLKNQATQWNENARYKVRNTVIYSGSYWVNVTGINSQPVSGSGDWIIAGTVNPVVGVGTRTYKYIEILSDASEIQDDELIGATEVTMIASTVAGIQMKSNITFVSVTGTIQDIEVRTGEEYQIFFTKP